MKRSVMLSLAYSV